MATELEANFLATNNDDDVEYDTETPKKKTRYENSNQEILENAQNFNHKNIHNISKIASTKPESEESLIDLNSSKKLQVVHPKKRLSIKNDNKSSSTSTKQVFRFGNYNRYYNYRNQKNQHDIRLDIFNNHKDVFVNQKILDIGCNSGFITIELSTKYQIDHITGLDIDKSLINKVQKYIEKKRKYFTGSYRNGFPFNINFVSGNYVVRDNVLLEIEKEQFDVILCLSVTKWIHLNFGDAGLKQAFKRMFLQLRAGGNLILEAQPWNGYKRRKKLTVDIFENYKSIQFFPSDFTNYLLGPEIGFSEVKELGIPEHSVKGFCRPIQVFLKK